MLFGLFKRKKKPEPTELDLWIEERFGVPLATRSDKAVDRVIDRLPYWSLMIQEGPFQAGDHKWSCLPYRIAARMPALPLGGQGTTRAEAVCECIRKTLEFSDGIEAKTGDSWWREQYAHRVGEPGVHKKTVG